MSKVVRLADHTLKIGSGQTPRGGESSYAKTGVPLIRSQNVLMGSFSNDGLAYISAAVDESMSGSRVAPGDVLLNITGASIGRVCVVPEEICPANVNQHVCIIRCDATLNPEYVATLLASPRFQSFIWGRQVGGTRQALTKQMIEEFEIPWLPLSSQMSIVGRLRTKVAEIDVAREAAKVQLQEANTLRNRLLVQSLSQLNAPLKRLQDVAEIQLGKMLSPKAKTGSSPYPYLRNQNVQWHRFDLNDMATMDFSEQEREKFALQLGDLLVCEGGEPGRCAIWREERQDCYYQKALHRVRPMTGAVDSEFLALWLHFLALTNAFEDQNAKTTIAHLPLVRLEQLPVPDIDISKQIRIAGELKEVLSNAKALVEASERQVKELQKLPSLILALEFER
ncbi:restriction endonuclease subunit S [Acidicapsa dinghuensis]|uniref:Restriction endonuclease subunit S n=1 Tax=Acidicapsa dinghuensis TaxID=2218256 RepID=A0ABW1ECW8_9BACT|nr:restriction endonuclease subunit S [Acidicapsa dinghuensis]